MPRGHRLRLKGARLFWHFSSVPFVLLPALFSTWSLFQSHFLGTYTGVREPKDQVIVQGISMALAITLFFVQKHRLRFKEVPIPASNDAFQRALARTAEQLGWRVVHNNNRFAQAHRLWNWSGSWGEMITIHRYKDHIVVNSICDPDARPSVVSWGWNHRNVATFIENLKQEVLGADSSPADK